MAYNTFALLGLLLLNGLSSHVAEYFPRGLFHEDPQWDAATTETVAEYLGAAGEVPLREGTPGVEAYRLTWLPNFDPAIIIRVTNSGPPEARVLRYSGLSPEEGVAISTIRLSCEEWEALRSHIEGSKFWGAMENLPIPKDQMVMDGSLWILEGVRDGNYKAVQRVFPRREREEDAAFLEVGLGILRIAGLDLEERDIY